ncbi:MAG: Long-chain-fatty-acid--CoA ligase, partial [Bacillota bacterium]
MPFDPWIRVHRRLGAEFVQVVPSAVTVTASVAVWE